MRAGLAKSAGHRTTCLLEETVTPSGCRGGAVVARSGGTTQTGFVADAIGTTISTMEPEEDEGRLRPSDVGSRGVLQLVEAQGP